MIVIGLIMLVIGYLLPLHLLVTLGIIFIVVGAVLFALSYVQGSPIHGRRYY